MRTERPAWLEDTVLYGIAPHNAGRHGLQSVTGRLGYLQQLGVNAIWLSPLYPTPTGGHGYEVSDYMTVRPEYGAEADLHELVRTAHARGLRVLLDFVPNHTSCQHPYFLHAQEHGPGSPYYDYYERDEAGRPTHYFDWANLPNLNYDNPRVQKWMLGAFAYWVREFDVDGFRVDAAWGIRRRRPDFWPRWRQEMKQIKSDLLLLAEASARDAYYFTEGFDAAYDWTDELGHWAWEEVFEEPEGLVERLHAALTNEGRGYHREALILRFLNNNDTGPRFITRYGPAVTRVAAALLLTLPGIPCIYLGDEVGAEFEPYRWGGPIAWEGNPDLAAYYARLIALRHRVPALRSRRQQRVQVQPAGQVYGYLRSGKDRDAAALVLLSFGPEVEAEVWVPGEPAGLAPDSRLEDALAGGEFRLREGGRLRVRMAAWSARILTEL